ncbi:MAG: hypothetical protein RLZZ490_1687, partial [Cyanobacteriota bacterium]
LVAGNVPLARIVEGAEKERIFTAVVDKQAELGLCSGVDDLAQNLESSRVYVRDQSQYLVSVLCFNAAYQGNYEFVAVDATQTPVEMRRADFSLAGYPTFDPVTSILTNSYKFTGAGTCFQNSSYYWDGFDLKLLSSTLVDGVENGCETLGVRSPTTDWLITANSVGPAKLGMTLGELKSLLPKNSQFKTTPLGVDLPVGMQVTAVTASEWHSKSLIEWELQPFFVCQVDPESAVTLMEKPSSAWVLITLTPKRFRNAPLPTSPKLR